MEPGSGVVEDTNTSPNERIMWDSKPDDFYITGISPMIGRKGRKRARSSSPISSPATDRFHPPARANVKKLAQALKSPHADPTLQLWDRYSLNKDERSPSSAGVTNPALAQLMISSSPRPSNTTRQNDGNLRRAMSHGLNWPKKRKVENSRSSGACDEQRSLEAASKSSLVTALLDTVTSSIQDHSLDEPVGQLVGSLSPKMARRCSFNRDGSPSRPRAEKATTINLDGFEYGDDDFDFDDDTLLELEASIISTQPARVPETAKQDKPLAKTAVNPTSKPVVLEEFDDLDDDVFDGAEDLVTGNQSHTVHIIDSSPPQKPAAATASILQSISEDFDDEFGDLNADDFEAVELAATQSVAKANGPHQAVRWNGITR